MTKNQKNKNPPKGGGLGTAQSGPLLWFVLCACLISPTTHKDISSSRLDNKNRDRYKEGTKNKESGVIPISRQVNEAIARGLRVARAGINKSRAEVARDIGVSEATLAEWERRGCLKFDDAITLAKYYSVKLNDLAGI